VKRRSVVTSARPVRECGCGAWRGSAGTPSSSVEVAIVDLVDGRYLGAVGHAGEQEAALDLDPGVLERMGRS
jgi:hypothetical protein